MMGRDIQVNLTALIINGNHASSIMMILGLPRQRLDVYW